MKDDFDKILSDKIKEVSSKTEIPYNPEHWILLQAKVKKEKRRKLFYWQIAAVFLISLLVGGIGKYFFDDNVTNENNINPQIILDTKNDSLRIDSIKTNKHIFITSSDFDSINNNSKLSNIDSISGFKKYKSTLQKQINKPTTANGIAISYKPIITKESSHINNTKIDSFVELNKEDLHKKVLVEVIEKTEDNNLILDSISNTKILAENSNFKISQKDSLVNKKELLAAVDEEKESSKKGLLKSLKLGLEVSPIFDYNQDNGSSNIGFAGGVTFEFPISNKFDINTGVFYADQKLNLNQNSTFKSDAVSARTSSQLINEEAVIKGIEIPLNIKYNFSVAKNDFFIAAGVTSTSYIKENIEANYLVNARSETKTQDYLGNNIVKYELVQTNSKITTPANSSTFNFANYINVSLGIKLPVNKQRQAIIIAPYFKYSLKPLTQQQIDFNSGGVHLRYNFSFLKNN